MQVQGKRRQIIGGVRFSGSFVVEQLPENVVVQGCVCLNAVHGTLPLIDHYDAQGTNQYIRWRA